MAMMDPRTMNAAEMMQDNLDLADDLDTLRQDNAFEMAPEGEYSKKALAFLIHIKPYLAQSYSDDDTSQYLFDDAFAGCLCETDDVGYGSDIVAVSKAEKAPDIYTERQMRHPEWDTPKQLEIAKIERLGAKRDVAADDPSIKGMPVGEMCWAGRCKRNADGSVLKYVGER